MKYKKLLISSPTKELFELYLANNVIDPDALGFIEEPKEIWALGKYYPCPYSKDELDEIIQNIKDEIQDQSDALLEFIEKIMAGVSEDYDNLEKIENKIKENASAIAQEVTNRTNADNTLQQNISQEVQDRKDAINALDVTDSIVTGKVVVKVEETDGKVSNTKELIKNINLSEYTSTGESGSLQINSSDTLEGAFNKVETYIKGLDTSNTLNNGEYITSLSETNGKIAYNKANVSSSPLNNYAKGVDGTAVKATDTLNQAISKLENLIDIESQSRNDTINSLDVDPIGTSGQYIYQVSETDGKIDALYKLAEAKEVKNESTKSQISSSTTVQTALDALADVATKQNVTAADKSVIVAQTANGTIIKVNIKDGENVLKLDTSNGLYTELKVKKLDIPSSSNILEEYELLSTNNTRLGDSIKVYKDRTLEDVSFTTEGEEGLSGQFLKFTYILADGNYKVVYVDMSGLIHESEFGDGIQVVNHVASVKKDTNSESFLSVSSNGIKVSGIQTAINTAKNSVQSNLDAEVERAKDAEKTLTDNLTAEYDRALSAEAKLQSNLTIEVNRAKEAEADLEGKINKEISDRQTDVNNAVGDLEDKLNTEKSRATTRENEIETALNNYKTANDKALGDEITRAKAAEGTLQTNIDNEAATRAALDALKVNKAGDTMTGDLTAPKFIKSGGTSAQFLKADGSVDSNTYATTAQLTNGSVTKIGTTDKGSATKGIYLAAGVPTEMTYNLNKDVPSNATFDDTIDSAIATTTIESICTYELAEMLPVSEGLGTTVAAGKYYYNNTANKTIGTFTGFSLFIPEAVIVSTYPITFINAKVAQYIQYLTTESGLYVYSLKYLPTSASASVITVNCSIYE